ncbi:MAG: recombinase zinc beta ribbon domain-containing protein [Devosia sp.]|nr:recombinase zinc beta ribbon domain-containing protein [Devosia sp.]
MTARASAGYWLFLPPVGYRFADVTGHGRMLVRDEPVASVVAEALNGYASGRLQTLTEVQRFLQAQPAYPKARNGEVHMSHIAQLLTRQLYAGYFSIESWGLHLVRGQHEALITLETHEAILARRQGVRNAPARKDLSADFPLRNFVVCGCCGEPLTACWSKGRSKRYPYYLCDTRGCGEYRKSVRKEKLEGEFDVMLASLQPTATLFHAAFAMIRELWEMKLGNIQQRRTLWEQELRQLNGQVEQLLDRAVEATSSQLAAAYERRIHDLELRKAVLNEKIATTTQTGPSFGRTYRTAFEFLANPCRLWRSERVEDRRAVLKLVWGQRLAYDRKTGYRTAETALPFKVLETLRVLCERVVEPIGIEPTTF